MSDSFNDDASNQARRQLQEACRTKDTSQRLAWAITAGEALLLGVLVIALADYWLMLPVGMRAAGAGFIALVAGAGLVRLIRFFRRPTPLKEAALDAEASRPELGCEVSTAAEYLSGEREVTKEYEPELVAALEAKAAEHLRKSQVPYAKRVLTPALVLGGTLLVLIGFILASPVAWTALRRAALPFSHARYTDIQVQPGNIEIPVGHDLEITNRFTGRAPQDPKFQWRAETGQEWQTAALTTRGSDGAYIYYMKDVRTDTAYRVTGNDAVSEVYHITSFVPPEVRDLSVQIEYPAYTHLPATVQKSPDISAVRASTVLLQVEPSVKLSEATLRFSSSPEVVPLQPGSNGLWSATLKVTKDTDYWIELADAKGRRAREEKPHHIKAMPDTPPKVDIEDPAQDMRASATNKVPVKISVGDDFGVENIELVFHKVGGPEQIVSAKAERDEHGEVTGQAELDLSTLSLSEFDVIAYHARAKDNNTLDGPGTGDSPVYFVEITNLEGAACKQKNPGQKLNLIAIQKQIIADTAALPPDAAPEKFSGLALRQRDAASFAETYLSTLTASAAMEGAISEMKAALTDMTGASGQLDNKQRDNALPVEESALAHLYQVLKQMPELEDLPTEPKPQQPPPPAQSQLAIVLEAIKQKKKEQPEAQTLEQALQQAEKLAKAQAEMNAVLRATSSQCEGQAEGEGSGESAKPEPGDKAGKSDKAESLKKADDQKKEQQLAAAKPPSDKASKSKGKGKGKGKGQGKGEGQGKGQGKGKGKAEAQAQAQAKGKGQGKGSGQPEPPAPPSEDQPPGEIEPEQTPAELAQQEEELSKEAEALGEKLSRIAGNDKRLGQKAGQNANIAGHKIAEASREIKKGNYGAAGVEGFQGEVAMQKVVAELQRIVRPRPEWTDVASEEAPKQFEPLISEYLKQLSHAE